MKYLAIFLLAAILMPMSVHAKGSSYRSSGSSYKSSSSTRSVSKPSTTTPSQTTKPSTRTVLSKPDIKKQVDSPVKTTASGKKTTGKANVVGDGYKPRIRGGYNPPDGSTVQYVERSPSFIDYLPWVYIFSQSSRDNINKQEAVVTEPDGTEKTVELEPEGGDGLLILNWIIMILLTGGLIFGIMLLVNKFSKK